METEEELKTLWAKLPAFERELREAEYRRDKEYFEQTRSNILQLLENMQTTVLSQDRTEYALYMARCNANNLIEHALELSRLCNLREALSERDGW